MNSAPQRDLSLHYNPATGVPPLIAIKEITLASDSARLDFLALQLSYCTLVLE